MNHILRLSRSVNICKRLVSRLTSAQANKLTDIGIRDTFTEEHDLFRDQVRRFFHEEIVPYHEKWEIDGKVSREFWLKCGAMGILGTNIPAEDHGIGADFYSSSIIAEELRYVNATGPALELHSDIVMPYISKYGTREQKDKYLPKMTSGEFIGSIAMTEPGAGSDLQGIRTYAAKDGDDWILSGSKVFITNGFSCDVVIVVAITDPQAKSPAHGISLFVVEKGMKGFEKGRNLKKMGFIAQDTAELFFEDVRLSKNHLLGELNKGFIYLMQELPRERLLIGIDCVAMAEFAFEETREYVKNRKAFNSTLSQLQTIKFKLAEMKTEICVSRDFVDKCIILQNEGTLDNVSASMAKYYTSDLVNRIAYDGVQMHGGWGYMWEYPICKTYVDARVQTIYGGANEIMKELISRNIIQ